MKPKSMKPKSMKSKSMKSKSMKPKSVKPKSVKSKSVKPKNMKQKGLGDDQMKKAATYIAILLIVMMAPGVAGCAAPARAEGLMGGVSPGAVSGRKADAGFIGSMADFSIELFKKSIKDRENSLISPLSVTLALAMTANGAGNETLSQMEKLLGGDIPLAELNEYLYEYVRKLPNEKKSMLKIANSIWFRDNNNALSVNPGFLQKNADYYQAAAFGSPFNSQTVKDVNSWVKANTEGMIDRILEAIDAANVMFLINAVMFDAEWQNVYYKENVREDVFTDIGGAERNAKFMHSTESSYLDDGLATGFIKPYANGGYSFAALLPNEGVPIGEYIETLTGASFLDTLKNSQDEIVYAAMPKFTYSYEITLNDALKALGIPEAFDAGKADFTQMATLPEDNIFISLVLHKTYIAVDELGTKAGAVTMVAMSGSGMARDPKTVRLDRPFVYAIIDNATNLPIFIGAVMTV